MPAQPGPSQPSRRARATASVVRSTPSARRASASRRSAVRRDMHSSSAASPRLCPSARRARIANPSWSMASAAAPPTMRWSTGPRRRRSSIRRSTTARSARASTRSPWPSRAARSARTASSALVMTAWQNERRPDTPRPVNPSRISQPSRRSRAESLSEQPGGPSRTMNDRSLGVLDKLVRQGNRMGSRLRAELEHHVRQHPRHRRPAEAHPAGDLQVVEATCHEPQDLAFSGGEPRDR